MTDSSMTLIISSSEQMEALGARIARAITVPAVIYLRGELGAGKTTLVRGVLRELGHIGLVKSPTFTLVESYSLNTIDAHHFDLYRLNDPQELDYIGLSEYCHEHSVCFFEWPDLGGKLVPKASCEIELTYHDDGRECSIKGLVLT